MAPDNGWYPDPAGMPQLRFWDGQNWTSATAPAPVTQPYPPQSGPIAMPQPGRAASGGPGRRTPQRGKAFYGVIAGVAAVAVAVAVVIPLTSGGSHHAPPTTAALKTVLLSVPDVSTTTTLPFTVQSSSDDNSTDDDDSTSCVPGNNVDKAETAAQTADASQSFVSKQAGLEVDEDIAYYPGKAATFMTAEKSAYQQCPTFKIGGSTVSTSFLPGLSVKDADDVIAIQASGTISGTAILGDTFEARFGDVIVSVNYVGGANAPQDLNVIAAKLLQQASAKAKVVL